VHLAPVGRLGLAAHQTLFTQAGDGARGARAVEHGALGQFGRLHPFGRGQAGEHAPFAAGDAVVAFAQAHHQRPRGGVDAVEPVEQQVVLLLRLLEPVGVGGHGKRLRENTGND